MKNARLSLAGGCIAAALVAVVLVLASCEVEEESALPLRRHGAR